MRYLLPPLTLMSLLLAACASTPTPDLESGVQAAIAATLTVQPTETATQTPNATPTDTPTRAPTNTPIPTLTPTPSAIEEVMGPVQGGELVYIDDFEGARKLSEVQLNLGIPHGFAFEGEGGARMWVEDSFAHSGVQCIGMELFDISRSRRNEFNVDHLETLTGDEYSVTVWLFFPTDFSLNVPDIDWNWMECLVLSEDANPPEYLPILRLQLFQPDITRQNFSISIDLLDVDGVQHVLDYVNDFPLPLGEWFNVHYYVNRDSTQSNAKVWMNGLLLFDVYDVPIREVDSFYTTIAKIYHHNDDVFPHRIWVDDLRIYRGFSVPAGASPIDLEYRD